MPIYRGPGGSGDASTDAYASLIAQYADTAIEKANQASASASSAEASKIAAETAEINAETAENNAESWAQAVLAVAGETAELDTLIDVSINNPGDNEILAYDTTSGEWINQTPAEASLATAAQGSLADTALQPADVGTAAYEDVTTSPTDTTAGRLLKVGDFGMAGAASLVSLSNPDADTILVTGNYYCTGVGKTNFPTTDTYLLTVIGEAAGGGRSIQYAVRAGGTTEQWMRTQFGGVWRTWYQVYQQSSILGTVSQAAGVPTGAVIERGSNANGEYVKFADGTMICTQENYLVTGHAMTVAAGNIFRGGALTWTYPSAFASGPVPSGSGKVRFASSVPAVAWLANATGSADNSNTTMQFCVAAAVSATSDVSLKLIAIGRWF